MNPPYTYNDLIYLLGQCTVELAWLRARVAELEAKLTEGMPAVNGPATPAEVLEAT